MYAGGAQCVQLSQVTGVGIPERGSQRASLGRRQPQRLLWVSPGLHGQRQPTVAAGTLHSQPCGRKHLQPGEQSRWAGLKTQAAKLQKSVRLRHVAPGSGVPCPSAPGCTPPSGPCRPGLPCAQTAGCPASGVLFWTSTRGLVAGSRISWIREV